MCKLERKTLTLSFSLPPLSLFLWPLFPSSLVSCFEKSQVKAGKKPQRIKKKSNSKMSHLKYHLMNRLVCVLTMGRARVLQRVGGSAGAALPCLLSTSTGWTSAHLPVTFPTGLLPAPPPVSQCGTLLLYVLNVTVVAASMSAYTSFPPFLKVSESIRMCSPTRRQHAISCPASLSADLLLAP